MSQDIRRDRELSDNVRIGSHHGIHLYSGDTPIGTMLTQDWAVRIVEAVANAKYYRDLAHGQNDEVAKLREQLVAANALIEKLQLRLNQQIDMERETSLRLRLTDYLDNLERNAGEDELAAEDETHPVAGTGLADQLFSRLQAANRARVTRKVVKGVREILADGQPQPSVRYWGRRFERDFPEGVTP